MSKFVCIYHVKEQILRKKFEISCNLSLDAMEVSERCKAAEQGPGAARDPCVVPAANAPGCPASPVALLTPQLTGTWGGVPLDRCACRGSPALAPLPGEGLLRAAVSPPPPGCSGVGCPRHVQGDVQQDGLWQVAADGTPRAAPSQVHARPSFGCRVRESAHHGAGCGSPGEAPPCPVSGSLCPVGFQAGLAAPPPVLVAREGAGADEHTLPAPPAVRCPGFALQEFLNRRKMTEFGNLALIDQDAVEEGAVLTPLPGARKGEQGPYRAPGQGTAGRPAHCLLSWGMAGGVAPSGLQRLTSRNSGAGGQGAGSPLRVAGHLAGAQPCALRLSPCGLQGKPSVGLAASPA